MVAEIVGINAVYGVRRAAGSTPWESCSRLARSTHGRTALVGRSTTPTRRRKKKAGDLGKDGRPSEANHGNVTPSFGKYTKGAEGRDPLPSKPLKPLI